VEATGDQLKKHAMIGLGVVAVDLATGKILSKFSQEIAMPKNKDWDIACVKRFWDNDNFKLLRGDNPEKSKKRATYELLQSKRQRVAKGLGENPVKVMNLFVSWVENILQNEVEGDSNRIKFLSDTVSFNSTWINYYLSKYIDREPLHLFFDNKFADVCNTTSFHQGLSLTEGYL
jgi:hypothetical protein